MSKGFNTNTKNNGEWLTPKYLTDCLGPFDLDPCSPIIRPWDTASRHFNINDNGLIRDWHGRVWCNPPYGKETFTWLKKMSEHRSGIALIFARTETKGFHAEIWNKAHSIFFFCGRLIFCYVDGTSGDVANAPSCLVSWSKEDSDTITYAWARMQIKGMQVFL